MNGINHISDDPFKSKDPFGNEDPFGNGFGGKSETSNKPPGDMFGDLNALGGGAKASVSVNGHVAIFD